MSDSWLIADLQRLTLDDYESAIRDYVDGCADVPIVRAIYQFGHVGAPGLSDVDLVVVLDDRVPMSGADLAPLSITHERWSDNRLIAACFTHDVYFVPEHVFRRIEWMIPGTSWTRRAGREVEREVPDVETSSLLSVAHGLDFCIGRLHEFGHLTDGGMRRLHWLVTELWSLTHTRRLLADAGVALEQSWGDIVEALTRLRATDVTRIRPDDVLMLVPPVRAHFEKATDHFAALMEERAGLREHAPKWHVDLALHSRRTLHCYRPAGDMAPSRLDELALARSVRFGGRSIQAMWTRLELPASVLVHHLAYLRLEDRNRGLVHRIARRAGIASAELGSPAYRRIVTERLRLAKHAEGLVAGNGVRLRGFGIPGLPIVTATPPLQRPSWRLRALRSWLDWTMLPSGAVQVGR